MAESTLENQRDTAEVYDTFKSESLALPAIIRGVLKFFASLKLTVVLLSLGVLLVFFGTLAQVDVGIWSAVRDYFRSMIVWVPLQIFIPRRIESLGIVGLLLSRRLADRNFLADQPGVGTCGAVQTHLAPQRHLPAALRHDSVVAF